MRGELTIDDLLAETQDNWDPDDTNLSGFDDIFSSMLDDSDRFDWDGIFGGIDWGTPDIDVGSDTTPADLPQDDDASQDDDNTPIVPVSGDISTDNGPTGLVSDDDTCPPADDLDGVGGPIDNPLPTNPPPTNPPPVVTAPPVQTSDWMNSTPILAILILTIAFAGIILAVRLKKRISLRE
jgi:hypothetical protein